MSRVAILFVYGPQHLIPGISAVNYYKKIKNVQNYIVQTIVYTPGLDESFLNEYREFIESITYNEGFLQPIFLNKDNISILFNPTAIQNKKFIIQFIKFFIGYEKINEIFFPHNLVGNFIGFCLDAYPNSEAITFGDGYGFIFDLLSENQKKDTFFEDRIKTNTWLFPIITRGIKKKCKKRKVVALLPINWGGNQREIFDLYIIPKYFALDVINGFLTNYKRVSDSCQQFLLNIDAPRYLLLLSNFSDNNYISFENELEFYLETVRTCVPMNASIIIKPHPFSKKEAIGELKRKLEKYYQIYFLPSDLKKYPIEILRDIIEKSEIIGFSSSIVSLNYLHEKEVIFPINYHTIEFYFAENNILKVKTMFDTYRNILDKLKTWDHKSIIYEEKIEL